MNFLCCLKPTTKKKHATNKNKKDCVINYGGDSGEENNDEQSRNAIAVAVATAAAADVAIVAAQSALRSVARLASTKKDFSFNFQIKYWAAVKIQSAFRAHLARKAFRALKGLVKLQAMVKGSLVRKKTALTFQSIQALIRAQSSLKSEGSPLLLYNNNNVKSQPSLYHRRSLENDQRTTSTIDVDTYSMSFSTSLPKIRVSDHYDYVSGRRNIHRGRVSMSTNNTPKYVSCSENSSSYHPNYMTNTRSFEAKVRSFSTPKQRPEFCEGMLMKRRVSLNEEVHSRESLSGGSLKGVVVERLDKSLELTRVGFGSNYRYKNRTEVSCD